MCSCTLGHPCTCEHVQLRVYFSFIKTTVLGSFFGQISYAFFHPLLIPTTFHEFIKFYFLHSLNTLF